MSVPKTMNVPVAWIKTVQCFNGSRRRADGLAAWWVGDDWVAQLLKRLDRYYDEGYQSLMLVLPGGTIGHPMKHDQWERLGRERQKRLADVLIDWRVWHLDCRLLVYMGWPPHPRDMIAEFAGWISCGIEGFGLDWASHRGNEPMTARYQEVFGSRGIEVIGEAIPKAAALRGPGRHFALARDHLWIDPGRQLVGPEIGVGIGGHPSRTHPNWRLTREVMVNHFRRGHFAVVYGDNMQWHARAMAAFEEAWR